MTLEGYLAQLGALTADGYFPVCGQACGADAASARFAAVFVKQQAIVPRTFTALGIFQLIEAGVLDPATSLQDILNLTAINGGRRPIQISRRSRSKACSSTRAA
jgi:hypothetical protein